MNYMWIIWKEDSLSISCGGAILVLLVPLALNIFAAPQIPGID